MKYELDEMMSLIKDYKTGYGGVTDSFMRKELEIFAKDYHAEQCNIADVVGRSEQLVCDNHHADLEHFMNYSESICKTCKQKV